MVVDLKDLKTFAKEGLAQSEAADRLGISRTRIGQIAKFHGIEFKDGRKFSGARRAPRKTAAPLSVAGIVTTTSTKVAGKAAEYLVVADLLARGWQVYIPVFSSRGYDVIACAQGNTLNIEVRVGRRSENGRIAFRKSPGDKCTHYAITLPNEPVTYFPSIPSGWTGVADDVKKKLTTLVEIR